MSARIALHRRSEQARRVASANRAWRHGAALLLGAIVLAGCTSLAFPDLRRSRDAVDAIDLIAVLPVRVGPPPPEQEGGEVEPAAEKIVTAAIYGALSSSYEWRFVPDIAVTEALRSIDPFAPPERQALALGKAVQADGVLFGSVWRFVERAGDARVAERGAAVGFTLRLLSVSSGEVVWERSFERAQTERLGGFLDWMIFWQDRVRWMSAAELAQAGVDDLFDDLRRRLS